MDKSLIICRCEEVTFGEIEEAIEAGCDSIKSIKRYTRSGMGQCQGRVCAPILLGILKSYGIEANEEDKPSFPLNPMVLLEMEGK